jgi:hypothetical protein
MHRRQEAGELLVDEEEFQETGIARRDQRGPGQRDGGQDRQSCAQLHLAPQP